MKTLMTIQSFYPCLRGPIINAFNVASGLENRGIHSPILTTYFGASGRPRSELIDNVSVTRYRTQMHIMKYGISLGMIKGLLQGCDIIHSHEYRAFQSDLGWCMSRISHKPFVITTMGNLLVYKYIIKQRIKRAPYILHDFFTFKNAVKTADKVIVTSKIEYQDAVSFGINKKILEIIPMGLDISLYYDNARIDVPEEFRVEGMENKLKLLFVGRLSPDRNLEPILYAIKDLPDVVFYVVGGELHTSGLIKDYINKLKQIVDKLGLSLRVQFIGQQSGKNLMDWYRAADVFINTSKYESFGLAILEAAAVGLPIISTPVGIANEIIKDYHTGFIVSENPSMIAKRIKEVFPESVRQEFGSKIREIVIKNYSWQVIVDKHVELYEALL